MIRLFLIVAAIALFSFSCSKEQATQNAMELVFSTADEVELGRIYAAQIDTARDFQPIDSTSALRRYVDSIGQALIRAQTTRPPDASVGFRYRFKIINTTDTNAFAVMGGHIYIYRGLINACKNEAELAGVMAHEIGHVVQRHGVSQLIKDRGTQTLLNVVLGEDPTLLKQLAGTLAGTRFSREDEYEADSCALAYSKTAGYNAFGMRDFLQYLKDNGLDLGMLEDVMGLVSTHPNTDDRITEVERILDSMGVQVTDPGYYKERLDAHR